MALDLQKSRWSKVYLVEIEFANRVDDESWTQEGAPNTNCWWISYATPGEPSRVEEDGTDYSEESALADCHSNSSSWYWDSANDKLYVHTSGSDDPGGASYIILAYHWEYLTNKQYEGSDEIVFNGNWYEPRLDESSVPDMTMAVSDFYQGGVVLTFGSLRIINHDGYYDQRLYDYIYEAKKIILKIGELGLAYADYLPILRGWTGGIIWNDKWVDIQIGDMREKFG